MFASQRGQARVLLLLLALALGAVIYLLMQGPGEEPREPSAAEVAAVTEQAPRESAPLTETETGGGRERVTEDALAAAAPGPRAERSSSVVRGRVVDDQGSGVAAASVTLTESKSPTEAFLIAQQPGALLKYKRSSDQNGEYAFDGLPANTVFDMWVHHDGFAPAEGVKVTVLSKEDQRLPDVVLKAGYTVFGTVTDTAGNPLAAQIELRMNPNFYTPSEDLIREEEIAERRRVAITAQPNGEFRVPHLAQGVWTLTASHEGYASAQVMPVALMDEGYEKQQDVQLGTENILRGVVMNDDREPLAEVRIDVSRSRPRPTFSSFAYSDPQGRFEVRGLPEGTYGLSAQAVGYSRANLPRVDANQENLEIILNKKGAVTGRVTSADGAPVARFRLEAHQVNTANALYGDLGRVRDYQDPNGNFVFDDLEPGTYVLLARAPSYAPTYSPGFHVEREVEHGVDIQLKRGGVLEGRVAALGGTPLAGAEVIVHGRDYAPERAFGLFGASAPDPNNVPPTKAFTDREGRFKLENVYVSQLRVEFTHASHIAEFLNVDMAEGAHLDVGTVELRRGGAVYGRALDGQGKPVAGGTAYLTLQDEQGFGAFAQNRVLDALGRFRFDGLKSGTYKLNAASATGGGFLFLAEAEGSTKTLMVVEGQEQEVTLTVTQ